MATAVPINFGSRGRTSSSSLLAGHLLAAELSDLAERFTTCRDAQTQARVIVEVVKRCRNSQTAKTAFRKLQRADVQAAINSAPRYLARIGPSSMTAFGEEESSVLSEEALAALKQAAQTAVRAAPEVIEGAVERSLFAEAVAWVGGAVAAIATLPPSMAIGVVAVIGIVLVLGVRHMLGG